MSIHPLFSYVCPPVLFSCGTRNSLEIDPLQRLCLDLFVAAPWLHEATSSDGKTKGGPSGVLASWSLGRSICCYRRVGEMATACSSSEGH